MKREISHLTLSNIRLDDKGKATNVYIYTGKLQWNGNGKLHNLMSSVAKIHLEPSSSFRNIYNP